MPQSSKAKSSAIVYSPHPSILMVVKWVSELKEKTGRDLDEWFAYIRKSGPDDLPARRQWLKEKHKLGTNTAWWLAERADGQPTWDESPEQYLAIAATYVDEMFRGSKTAMRPLGDALMRLAREVSTDIKLCPCKTIIPFYRNHVIAEIKPSTKTRIDFGLALGKDVKFTSRFKDTGGLQKKDRITHKVEVTSLADLDAELKAWLNKAYDRDE
ncbi:MAG: DUF4287 domain-containing protein [Gemmataceae bacterium]|nr:DUF4287 domain-containing protein [Gemmataceae bacterium]